jgi:hypothetical protein
LLEVEQTKVETALLELVKQRRIIIEPQGGDQAVYLTPLHVAEVNVAKRLETLINAPRQMFPIEKVVPKVDKTYFEVFRPMFEFIKSKCPPVFSAPDKK